MKVIVCGGRNFANWKHGFDALDKIHDHTTITRLANGGAAGADAMASGWALARGVEVKTYHADWETHGRAAGPIRNQQMLDAEDPQVVIAFTGGKGTEDMIAKAKRKGVGVIRT